MRRVLAMLATAIVVGYVTAGMGGPRGSDAADLRRCEVDPERDGRSLAAPGAPRGKGEYGGRIGDGDRGGGSPGRAAAEDPDRIVVALRRATKLGPQAVGLVNEFVALMDSENAAVREALTDAIIAAGESIVEPLIRDVVRMRDAKGLWWGNEARTSLRITTEDISILALSEIGEPAVVPIAETLGHEGAGLWARHILEDIRDQGGDLARATPVLLRHLAEVKSKQPLLSSMGAVLLLGTDAPRAVPALTALLQDERRDVRGKAVLVLGSIGPDASAALTDLEYLLADTDPGDEPLRTAIQDAFAKIRGEE